MEIFNYWPLILIIGLMVITIILDFFLRYKNLIAFILGGLLLSFTIYSILLGIPVQEIVIVITVIVCAYMASIYRGKEKTSHGI